MKIAILHYSIPPVVGGVEAVIQAHTQLLLGAGYSVTLIAGAGDQSALPDGTRFIQIPEMNSLDPHILEASQHLKNGKLPEDFDKLVFNLERALDPALQDMDHVIIHNIFTKHFNLPLTAALYRLLDKGKIRHCIAWGHDFSWTSPHSQPSVHQGYPWDLLRTYRENVTYVTVSKHRQLELAGLYQCHPERIKVIYDGIDPEGMYGLSPEGQALVNRLGLSSADLILLMPVRITQAKNIEYALQVVASLKMMGVHPKLVITGPPDPHDTDNMAYYRTLLDLRRELGVEQDARFVYESGPQSEQGYRIDLPLVREVYRSCDVLFMPSHREGFGMTILEAGLIGMQIFSTKIPAAEEIGGAEVIQISPNNDPDKTAALLKSWYQASPTQRLRQRIRQHFTWGMIFQHDILPLIGENEAN